MTRRFGRVLRRNTIALLALFVSLGGTTYAASSALIGRNTVASPQVVNGSLQTFDLSKKARTTLKGNRGLRGLRGAKGDTGARGTTGPPGPLTGPAGGALTGAYPNPGLAASSVGSANLKGTYAAVTGGIPALGGTPVQDTATCHPGDRVLGGGFSFATDSAIYVMYSTPGSLTNPNSWIARAESVGNNTFYVWALCLAA
jgi:hypothetical protein